MFPPDKRGLIHKNDIKALKGMRHILDETFTNNLAADGKAFSSTSKQGNEAQNILDDDLNTFWAAPENVDTASITIELNGSTTFNRAVLQENILEGQRVDEFHLEYWDGSKWTKFSEATTIGYKRILSFPVTTAEKIRIVIDRCRTNPTLASFGIYSAPPDVKFNAVETTFEDSTSLQIETDRKDCKIYYTTDGSMPDESSNLYEGTIIIKDSAEITAIAISSEGKRSMPETITFTKVESSVKVQHKL